MSKLSSPSRFVTPQRPKPVRPRARGRPPDPSSRKEFTQCFASVFYCLAGSYGKCEKFFFVGDQDNLSRKGETWRKYVAGERGFSQSLAVQRTLRALTVPFEGAIIGDESLVDLLVRSYPRSSFTESQRVALLTALRKSQSRARVRSTDGAAARTAQLNFLSKESGEPNAFEDFDRDQRILAALSQDAEGDYKDDGSPPWSMDESESRNAAAKLARLAARLAGGWREYVESDRLTRDEVDTINSSAALRTWLICNFYVARELGLRVTSVPMEKNNQPARAREALVGGLSFTVTTDRRKK